MRYLLDTHTFLWWATDDLALPETVQAIVADTANDIFFSAVSAWEIAIKTRLRRTGFQEEAIQRIPEQITANGLLILRVEIEHTLRVAALPLLHRDPFDRLLIAQAQMEDLAILTADPSIARYDVAVAW